MHHHAVRRTLARLAILGLIAAGIAVPAGLQVATPATAAAPPTGTAGGGLFHLLTDPRATLSSPYENELVVGPDGHPWFTHGESLYSITADEVPVPHALPGPGRFEYGPRKLVTAPDGAPWTTGPTGMFRVTADDVVKQVATFPGNTQQSWTH